MAIRTCCLITVTFAPCEGFKANTMEVGRVNTLAGRTVCRVVDPLCTTTRLQASRLAIWRRSPKSNFNEIGAVAVGHKCLKTPERRREGVCLFSKSPEGSTAAGRPVEMMEVVLAFVEAFSWDAGQIMLLFQELGWNICKRL